MSNIYDKASLVLIPSGTKTSKVYSQKPVNGDGDFTFSRSTAATRVNADGFIEKETQNLLLQSNSFDTTWQKVTGSVVTGGQAGYDGTNDAWLLSKPNTGSGTYLNQNISASGVNTFSVYAKENDSPYLAMFCNGAFGGQYFDLQNGVLGNTFLGTPAHASITSIGSGWYRCSITLSSAISDARCYAADVNSITPTGSIYIQDAQLEQGMVARDVLTTTTTAVEGGITDNVPRLDYTDASCPSLLLEPQRSNLLVQSEYYATTPYARVNASVTHNDATSPEGVVNSAKLESSSNSSASRIETFPTLTDNTNYTASIFAKQGDVDYIMVNFRDKNGDQHNTYFDLSDGTKGSSNGSPISTSIEAVGDYYRVTLTINSSSGASTPRLQYLIANTDNNVVTASGEYIYVYGAQLEEASYATSYIPTYGSAVTRNEDVFKVSNVGTNNLVTDDAFTLFIDVASATDSVNNFADIVAFFGNNNFRIETRTSGQVRAQQQGMVVSGDNFNAIPIGDTSNTKYAFTFTTSQCKIYVDGTLHSTYNGVYTHDLEILSVRNSSSLGAELKNEYKKVMLFPTALSEAECIDLTTI